MTSSELKCNYECNNPSGHFFDRKSMKFFGDTMRNYGVRDAGDDWELYRKSPVKHGLNNSHFFNKKTFAHRSI